MKDLPGIRGNHRTWKSFQEKIRQPAPRRKSFRAGFKLLGLLLVFSVGCVSLLYAAKGQHPFSPPSVSTLPLQNPELKKGFQPPINGSLPHFEKIVEGKFTEEFESCRFIYTVDPSLQGCVKEIFRSYRPSFSAFVAMEPKTGKILALAEYARGNPNGSGIWQRASYPAASIFKLITAAGALEKGFLEYDSSVSFRGNQYRLGPQKLTASTKRDRKTNFDDALGKSNNVVFGRVASKLLGSQTLREYSHAFGFNNTILFDFPLDASKAIIPEESYELARCGAGFGDVTLNPLHAAMIAGCIANRGMMMRPYLIAEIDNRSGEQLYQAKAEILSQPIAEKTAQDLGRMMQRTVEDGTASKIFNRYGKSLLKKISICGKTGSLSGDNPPGQYDWFIGFAPADDPRIAFAAMIINQQRWRMKGAFVAQEALKDFFRGKLN